MSHLRAVCSAAVSRPRFLSLAVLLTAVLAVAGAQSATGQSLPSVPGAPGTTSATVEGSTIIRLDPILFSTLTAGGAKVRTKRPATKTKTGAKFRVSGIQLGGDGASVLLKHKGEMRISTRSRSLRITNPTVSLRQTDGSGDLIATVNRKRVKLATVQVDIGNLEQTGTAVLADNVNLVMTTRLARELNRVLGTTAFLAGTTFGKASVRVLTG